MQKNRSLMTQGALTAALALALCTVAFVGCGLNRKTSSSGLTTDCILSADQGATLTGKWPITAVPIAFQSGAWNSSEMQAMIAAADTWNQFFSTSMGYPAIDYGSAASPRLSSTSLFTSTQNCTPSSAISGNQFATPIVIYKDGTWSYGSQLIALTTSCFGSGSSAKLTYFQNAYMEVNYQNFFVSGQEVPDLQSIVLHEMGHLMGINHSCAAGSTTTGFPDCNSGTIDPSYLHASMFPSFSFFSNGTGEIRRNLNVNDQGRMNCVYKYL